MKIKVSEASGPALDWMVAKCEGYTTGKFGPKWAVVRGPEHWGNESEAAPSYSIDWSQGGPIIEREKIELRYHDVIVAGIWYRDGIGSDECSHKAIGPTPLIAAMRCYVASKLGDEVEVPDELIDDEPQPCPTCGEDGGTSCGAIDCGY